MRAEQGPCEPIKGCIYAKLESNSEPERARVCQRVAVRARVGVTESLREPERSLTDYSPRLGLASKPRFLSKGLANCMESILFKLFSKMSK